MARRTTWPLWIGVALAAMASDVARSAPPEPAIPRAASSTGATVSGRVRVSKPNGDAVDPAGVVVYLEGLMAEDRRDQRSANPQIRQRDLQFAPALTVVVLGTTVDFPNDDKVFHNVFSFSEAAKFDLGLYKSGTSKSVTLRKPGVVNVYCNIHPEMISKIKVLDSTYFAIVGADGTFRIEHVPAGSHSLVAWQPHGSEYRGQVTIAQSGTTQVDIALVQGRPDLRHTRKDGTPYGRYK